MPKSKTKKKPLSEADQKLYDEAASRLADILVEYIIEKNSKAMEDKAQ